MTRTTEDIAAAKSMRRINQAIYVVWRYTHDEAQRADAAKTLLSNWRAEHGGIPVAMLCEACGYRRKDLQKLVAQEEMGTAAAPLGR